MRLPNLILLPLLTFLLGHAAAFAAPPHIATLAVENMTCGTCPIVVKKALERVSGVSAVKVDFDNKTATVTFDPDKTTPARLTQATSEAGFPSTLTAKP
jgi:mercuric ion binding protein